MNYEEKYDNLVGWIDLLSHTAITSDQHQIVDIILQKAYEQEESEDERIRKELIDFVKSRLAGFSDCKRFIAWLEKQCQVKDSANSQHENKTCEEKEDSLTQAIQKPAEWSEEDSHYLCGLIGLIEQSKAGLPITLKGKAADNCIDWLKSLRPQSRWKPSEEQLKALRYFITSNLPRYNESTSGWTEFDNIQSLYNDLKKLREE